MSSLKLTYFKGPGGRAEPARIALHVAGIQYDDDRLPDFRAWASELKRQQPYGAVRGPLPPSL